MKIEIELDEERKLRSVVVDGAKLVDAEKQMGYVTDVEMHLSTMEGTNRELVITTLV